MTKVTLHFKFIPLFFLLFQLGIAQEYISLNEDFKCGVSNAYSIYATADDVDLLTGYLDTCGDLEYLKIIGNKPGGHWDLLFEVLSTSKNLKGLELYYNEGLTEVPKKIIKNTNLKVITIVGNRRLNYNDLFKKLSKLKNLESIALIDNKLNEIPDALGGIKQLRKLKVSGNEGIDYSVLISQLKRNEQLEELYIPLNSISEIPENIGELKGLKTLDIRNNYIIEFPNSISNLDSLQELRTEDNIILDVSNEFNKLKNLNIKYLSYDQDNSLEDLKLLFPDANIHSEENKRLIQSEIIRQKSNKKSFNNVFYVECWNAIDHYNTLFKKRFSYSNFDSLDFFSRLTNTNYCYNDRVVADGSYEGLDLFLHTKPKWIKNGYELPRYKLNKGEIGFSINPKGNYYPELKAFTGMVWIYVGGKTEQDFYKTYVKNKTWKDIYLEYDFSTKTFFIVLKDNQLHKIPAYPRYINRYTRLKDAQKQYNKRFNMYDKRLNLRAKRFDRSIEKEYEKNRIIYNKWETVKWGKLEGHMCEYEKTLKRDAWLDFKKFMINKQHIPLDTVTATKELLIISLKIRRLRFDKRPVVSVKTNLINSVSAFIKLNIKDSLRVGNETINMFLYRKDKGVMDFYRLDGTTSVEFDINNRFVVIIQKRKEYLVLSKKEFMNEIRGNFRAKGKIEIRFLKPFKRYSLSDLWRAIEFKEEK